MAVPPPPHLPPGMPSARTETLFDVLGLPITSDEKDIKRAYKEQALKCHPDKGGDAEMFKKVNEAYDILMDDEQREKYIELLRAGSHSTLLDQFVKQQEAYAKEHNLARPSSKYERTCRMWARGKCTNPNCMYRHYKTADDDKMKINKVCHDYTKGYCRFGSECQFKHPGNLDKDDQSNWEHFWTCNDVWRSCKAQNHILNHPKRCHVCGAKRKLARCKHPVGTTVALCGSHTEIMEEVIKKILFFSRDGLYKKQMHKLITRMQQTPLYGQVVPKVTRFYPSANCYHVTFQDGNFLIVPEKYLRRGQEKWQCTQCKYENENSRKRCALCDAKNPTPMEDWSPFFGTWKSLSGQYYITIEDHNITSSDGSHYYTDMKLIDGTLSFTLTILEDDEDDDFDDSSDEEAATAAPEPLGKVALRLDGRKRLRGELKLLGGGIQRADFVKIEVADHSDDSSVTSSSFDSRESTPEREQRLREKQMALEMGRQPPKLRRRSRTPDKSLKKKKDDRDKRDRERDRKDQDRRSKTTADRRDRHRSRSRDRDYDRRRRR